MNALGSKTRAEIVRSLNEIEKNKETKCLIIRGAGRRAFSSGEDLQESINLSRRTIARWAEGWSNFLTRIMKFPLPIVTASAGYVVGAGWQLFLLGDYRISSTNSRFTFPEVDRGLPSILSGAIIASMIGMAHLGRLTLMGDEITAKEALGMGIVHKIVPQSELGSISMRAARELAGKPITAVRLQRSWIQHKLLEDFRRSVRDARSIYEDAFRSNEPKREISAFLSRKIRSKRVEQDLSPGLRLSSEVLSRKHRG